MGLSRADSSLPLWALVRGEQLLHPRAQALRAESGVQRPGPWQRWEPARVRGCPEGLCSPPDPHWWEWQYRVLPVLAGVPVPGQSGANAGSPRGGAYCGWGHTGGFAAAEGAVGTSRVRLNGSHSRAGWTSLALRPPPFCAPPSPGRSPSRIAGLGGVSRCSSLASRFSASWTPRLPRHTRHMPQGNRAFSPAPENEGRKLLPDCVTAD